MKDKGDSVICPHCGYNMNSEIPKHHLQPGTILGGKYWVGNAIGEGGFGITYIGYNLNLEIKVAIKEYFPNGLVSRDTSNTDTVTIFSGSTQQMYEQGREKFVNEARALAKFDNLQGIVSVKDFFMENGTAYIVMEYVEGETLKSFLRRNGGKIPSEDIFVMMTPLMKSLAEVHKKGLIHRDISPDNIMITADAQVKLLDFGAARDISANGNKSLSIQLKPGYAPEEQYRTHGKQGPWTDVYSLCATMYRAITGIQPIESLERLQNDTLQRPSALGIAIDPIKENAIMNGMEIFADRRFQNIDALYNALFNSYSPQNTAPYTPPLNIPKPASNQPVYPPKNNTPLIIAIAGAFVAICVIICAVFAIGNIKSDGDNSIEEVTAQPSTPVPTEVPVPVFGRIEASSTRGTDMTSGAPVEYFPAYAMDGNYATTWSPNRNVSLTPTLTLLADTKQYVTGIKMANGYFKSEETYRRNRRITKVMVEYEGGQKTQSFGIDQYRIMQDVRFDAPVMTSYIKVHILDTHYGDWKDICISEIEVY